METAQPPMPQAEPQASTTQKIVFTILGGVIVYLFLNAKHKKKMKSCQDDTAKDITNMFNDLLDKAQKSNDTLSGFAAKWRDGLKSA